ncbi:DNA-binding NarL/FixJ family response regulator [Ralstonia sp. 1138]
MIIDINLTRLDGLELVRRVRAQHAIGIVVTSGGNSIEDSRLAFHAGANAYVNKSAPISVLNAALILAGNGYVGFPSRSISITFSKRKVGASGKLTARELRVQQLLAEGCRNVEVAQRLGVSPKTVATFKNRILKKMSGEG